MSIVAIFELHCCQKEIVFGRFRGDEMYPPIIRKCPYGCKPQHHPSGKVKGHELRFLRYEDENMITPELLATWRFPDRTKIQKTDKKEKESEVLF